MPSIDPRTIILESVEAHGGLERWQALEALEAQVTLSGLLLAARWRPALRDVWLRVSTRQPRVVFYDFPRPGQRGELLGNKEIRVLDGRGSVITSRPEPRRAFRHPRRLLYWDRLDLLYLAGYMAWGSLLAPFNLLREDLHVILLEPADDPSGPLQRIQVTFPSYLPTHASHQVYAFDSERRLRRVEYTSEPVGEWVRVAQLAEAFRPLVGLTLATRHRLVPHMADQQPWTGLTLANLAIHQVRLAAL